MGSKDEHLLEVGRISAAFNTLEGVLRQLVWILIRADEEVHDTVMLGETFGSLREKLRRLVEIRIKDDEELRAWILRWLDDTRHANDLRVEAIHSLWISVEGYEEKIASRVTRSGKHTAGFFTAAQLSQWADAIYKLGAEGIRIWERLDPDYFERPKP